MNKSFLEFPLDIFEELIKEIGWESLEEWLFFWEKKDKFLFDLYKLTDNKFKEDWIWGLLIPLLSDAYKLIGVNSKRKVIGLSALPGTGKTTLGLLLEKISLKLNFKISVVSMDDFYLPAKEMEKAINKNPWEVSRGFPGSHSINLLEEKILLWKETGILNVPFFDKSLRLGLGDRSYWKKESPDLVILEGWFLGVNPITSNSKIKELILPELTSKELDYRLLIQRNLHSYLKIWKSIDKIWQLKPEKFLYMKEWKSQQEREMFSKKGSALKDKKLLDFLRMLYVCIPHQSFDEINSQVLLILNQNRKLVWVGKNK